jgi:hypothetical protein
MSHEPNELDPPFLPFYERGATNTSSILEVVPTERAPGPVAASANRELALCISGKRPGVQLDFAT